MAQSNFHSKRATSTKRGPGRYHQSGATKSTPIVSKGAPRGFVLHKASAEKKERKAAIKALGSVRQFKRETRTRNLTLA